MAGKLAKINLNNYQPLRDIIFNTLREAIIMGELKPGERLMEVQLAEKMGVSRTPVREAIRKLELEELVEMLPRKGAHVANLSTKNIMDVLEVRANLDSLASELSAQRITEAELRELNRIHEQFEGFAEKENLQGLVKKDIEFHDIIYKSSKNQKLVQIAVNLKDQILRFRIIYLKDFGSIKDVAKEHAEIIKAISARDAANSCSLAKKHIKRQEEAIVKAISKNEG